jgi:Ca-activated chloride channel homolog
VFALGPQFRFRRAKLFSLCFSVCLISPFARATAHVRSPKPCAQASGQQPVGHVLHSQVNLQTVDVQVTDKSGKDVGGLTANDFTVREDGERQDIAFFDAGAAPVTVAVLVDSSASMSENSRLGSAEQVAAEFMRLARPSDDIYAMDFTEHTGPFEHLRAEQLRNPGVVTMPSAGGEGSAVYDAIASAICHLRDSKNPRQAIIVITDGVDEHSRLSLDQLVDIVRSQSAQLFLIGLHSKPEFRFRDRIDPTVTLVTGHDIDNPEFVFYRLAKEAGAATFALNSESGLKKALQAVSDMLNAEYTIAYYPPPTDRKLRKIEVKVNQHGVRVLASRTIVSNQDSAEMVTYLPGTCVVSPTAYPYGYEPRITGNPGRQTYRDDFSNSDSGWPKHPDSHYVPGGYELSTVVEISKGVAGEEEKAPSTSGEAESRLGSSMGGESPPVSARNSPHASTYRQIVIAAYGPPWPDFRISASVKAVFKPPLAWNDAAGFSLPVHSAAGLAFRITWKGYYALLVSPAEENKRMVAFELVARTFVGDSYRESVILPWKTVPSDSPLEAQLAVQDVGDQIALFIDGHQVGAARDDTFENGYAGFIVSAPAHATFSTFLLEQK